jgi:hypothetical protein
MWVTGLDGKEYNLKLRAGPNENSSSLHDSARSLLTELFSFCTIYEEVNLPGSRLRFDFFVPNKQLFVETDGRQHSQFSLFFHKTRFDYLRSNVNDRLKEEFCRLNGFKLVRLPYDESTAEWRERLNKEV